MKIDTKTFSKELKNIVDADGMSISELAAKSGISRQTLYEVIEGQRPSLQRATMRRIAEATGRDFKIDGDKVTFVKRQKKEEEYISPIDKELIEKFNKLGDEQQRIILDLLGSLCRQRKTGADGEERNS